MFGVAAVRVKCPAACGLKADISLQDRHLARLLCSLPESRLSSGVSGRDSVAHSGLLLP